MPLTKSTPIKKILIISLSNIGDVILTFPVIDTLREHFRKAKLSVVVGPKVESFLKGNPLFEKVYIFEKKQNPWRILSWIFQLRKEHFDLVVDLRNTAIPFFISAKYRTPFFIWESRKRHMRDKHIERLKSICSHCWTADQKYSLFVSKEDKSYVDQLMRMEIGMDQKYVVIAPGAADQTKRWTEDGFAETADELIRKYNFSIVFVGAENDREVVERIIKTMTNKAINFCGRLSLRQLEEFLQHCELTIVNDSAVMHLASYVDVPIVALFGPTDPAKYGPWSSKKTYLRKILTCLACHQPKNNLKHQCMRDISSLEVLEEVKRLLEATPTF